MGEGERNINTEGLNKQVPSVERFLQKSTINY